MRLSFLQRSFAVVFCCIPVIFLSAFTLSGTRLSQNDCQASFEEEILRYVNEYRQTKSLAPLQMNAVISAQAVIHSRNMAAGKTAFGHDGFDGRVSAISRQLPSRKYAENVAYGHLGAKEVVDVWLNSPGHRRNIEGAFRFTGIGTAKKADGTIFFTQLFTAP